MDKANIDDVARLAGLSISTVSRVLNGITTVSEMNRQRVCAAIEQLQYHPDPAAQWLAAHRRKTAHPATHQTWAQPLEGSWPDQALLDYS